MAKKVRTPGLFKGKPKDYAKIVRYYDLVRRNHGRPLSEKKK